MNVASSFLKRNSIALVMVLTSVSAAHALTGTGNAPINNVASLSKAQVPALSDSAKETLDNTGTQENLDPVDTGAYSDELSEISKLQRERRVLKLAVEVEQLKSELKVARDGASTTGASETTQAVSKSASPSLSWKVSAVHGSGSHLAATLVRGNEEVEVLPGRTVLDLGRVTSIRADGVSIASNNGNKFLPFSVQ